MEDSKKLGGHPSSVAAAAAAARWGLYGPCWGVPLQSPPIMDLWGSEGPAARRGPSPDPATGPPGCNLVAAEAMVRDHALFSALPGRVAPPPGPRCGHKTPPPILERRFAELYQALGDDREPGCPV